VKSAGGDFTSGSATLGGWEMTDFCASATAFKIKQFVACIFAGNLRLKTERYKFLTKKLNFIRILTITWL
jgi:hypothetical protein